MEELKIYILSVGLLKQEHQTIMHMCAILMVAQYYGLLHHFYKTHVDIVVGQ